MAVPRLFIFIGYPGAGKTTIAQFIAKRSGAAHIWADVERQKMFDQPTHSMKESHLLYDQLNDQAGKLLATGQSVIFDTNFNHLADRQKLREIAASNAAEMTIIWVTTPKSIAKDRAVHSNVVRNGYDFAMDSDQFEAIAAKLEPPTEDEKVIKIDGSNVDLTHLAELLQL